MSEQDRPLPISSSTHPDFPPEQRRLFREVLELMNSRGIPFAVSGAFALHQHTGIWRDTKDLDLFMPAEQAGAALHYLREDGFEVEVPDPSRLRFGMTCLAAFAESWIIPTSRPAFAAA